MAKYKGNVGNLMQHWTLCEVLHIANTYTPGLSFIDSYAMAPWATRSTRLDETFKSVKNRLPGKGSAYERAWHSLSRGKQENGYPNSAALVQEVWRNNFSFILCEIEEQTADEINKWLQVTSKSRNCTYGELFRGDWRERFVDELPDPSATGLPAGSLTVISFDPTMYDSENSPVSRCGANLYRTDLGLVLHAVGGIDGPTIIQLSTYNAGDNNPQNKVIESINSVLTRSQFQYAAVVIADENMMSLVYTREIDWSDDLAGLPIRFAEWLRQTS